MIMEIEGKDKKDGKYRVRMVIIQDGKDGFDVNFSATTEPKGEQVKLIQTYRNMIVNKLEILNAELGMLGL